jgi:hypothetical protein
MRTPMPSPKGATRRMGHPMLDVGRTGGAARIIRAWMSDQSRRTSLVRSHTSTSWNSRAPVTRAPIELGTAPGTDANTLTGAKCRSRQMRADRGVITGPGRSNERGRRPGSSTTSTPRRTAPRCSGTLAHREGRW